MCGEESGFPSLARSRAAIAIAAAQRRRRRSTPATKPKQGVHEKDEVRREDSFRTFEEILQKAVEQRVDMVVRMFFWAFHFRARCVEPARDQRNAEKKKKKPPQTKTKQKQLLGGDLFHDPSPCKATLVRAVSLLKRYCLGDRPVRVQLLSDEKRCFASGRCNYLDPDLNVGLPVFTIHGNHDDATGAEYMSAVDVLSSAGLVNYFGKVVSRGATWRTGRDGRRTDGPRARAIDRSAPRSPRRTAKGSTPATPHTQPLNTLITPKQKNQ